MEAAGVEPASENEPARDPTGLVRPDVFAPIVKAGHNRPGLVRLISPSALGPRARGQPTFVTLCPTTVGG